MAKKVKTVDGVVGTLDDGNELKLPKIRVVVPYPNHGDICARTRQSLHALTQCPDVFVEIMEIRGSSISHTRNVGVTNSASCLIKQKTFDFDFYLSVDADVVFKPEDVLKLVSHNLDIVGGAYNYRVDPLKIVAGYFNDMGNVGVDDFISKDLDGLREVGWIGAGFTLIKRNVFETLRFPYYREVIIEYTDRGGNECASWVGEDVGFCMAAKKAGFKIFCDCDCKVEHLTEKEEKPLLQFGKENFTLEETSKLGLTMLDYVKNILVSYHQKLGAPPPPMPMQQHREGLI